MSLFLHFFLLPFFLRRSKIWKVKVGGRGDPGILAVVEGMNNIASVMVMSIEDKVWPKGVQDPLCCVWCQHCLLNNCVVPGEEEKKKSIASVRVFVDGMGVCVNVD